MAYTPPLAKHLNEKKTLLSGPPPFLVVFYGTDDYLLHASCEDYVQSLQKKAPLEVQRLQEREALRLNFAELAQQSDLFSPHSLYIFSSLKKPASLTGQIKAMGEGSQNHFAFVIPQKTLPKALLQACQQKKALLVSCQSPLGYELPDFILTLAKRYHLKLSPQAVRLILHHQGEDLFRIDNEIRKLSYLFASEETIGEAQLKQWLGVTKMDHIFKLEQYLLSSSPNRAAVLADSLLKQGESFLGIVALLSQVARKGIRISQWMKEGKDVRWIARQLYLPLPVVKTYFQYINQFGPKPFKAGLKSAQAADMSGKSSRQSPNLLCHHLFAPYLVSVPKQ